VGLSALSEGGQQIFGNNPTPESSNNWEFVTMKMLIAPMTFASLALLSVYSQSHIPCAVMGFAQFVSHLSL
jgi:hypothetical protein